MINEVSSAENWEMSRKKSTLARRSAGVTRDLALARMARDDQPASSTAAAMRGKVGWNLKPKLAIMRQCTSVTDGQTDRQTDTDIVS